jgi:formate/nitrite transporter FocA (FNT family)
MSKPTDDDAKKAEEIEERTAPPGVVVYEAIYGEAEHELSRDSGGLAWSGLAAGLSMGFSMLAQALLQTQLGETPIGRLISPLGYTVGFLIVILGRQQLFTENTLTPILPLLKTMKGPVLWNVARLWAVVLATNLIGGFVFAWVVAHTPVADAEVRRACADLGRKALELDAWSMFARAIMAGWLIAMMVWLLPFAETSRIWVIMIISYLVGLAHFPHIIAGGVEVFYLLVTSKATTGEVFGGFVLPTLLGNTIGGVALVAGLAHAQFMAGERGKQGQKKIG